MKIWIFICITLILCGCENERPLYDGEKFGVSGIYFQYTSRTMNGKPIYQDSILFSFQNVTSGIEEYELKIPVKLLGFVADYPRAFKVNVCGGSAIEGEDFLALKNEYIFPADTAESFFPIILKRTEKLIDKEISIELELVENNYFHLLMPQIISAGDTLDATRFKVVYSEIITKPFYWLAASSYFGDFSPKKIQILNRLMEWSMEDWKNAGMADSKITMGKFNYAATIMKNELQNLADAGTPCYEADGTTLMQLANDYKVDYSNYE